MVKGLKGTRQNLNCNMVIKLTMGLRLNFLKPLMLKIPTESNGGWIHLFLKKGNFLHYFILRKCKIQTTAAIWKKVIMSVPAAICGEHEQESTWWPDQFLKVGGQKYINLLCLYCGDAANTQTQAGVSWCHLLWGTWHILGGLFPFPSTSLSAILQSRVCSPKPFLEGPTKEYHNWFLH